MVTKKADQPPQKKKGKTAPQEEAVETKFQLATVREFAVDVQTEFGKIVWPDKKHTMGSTVVVTIMVMLISFYLGAVDLILGWMIGFLFH